jgi:hypothetical protein
MARRPRPPRYTAAPEGTPTGVFDPPADGGVQGATLTLLRLLLLCWRHQGEMRGGDALVVSGGAGGLVASYQGETGGTMSVVLVRAEKAPKSSYLNRIISMPLSNNRASYQLWR